MSDKILCLIVNINDMLPGLYFFRATHDIEFHDYDFFNANVDIKLNMNILDFFITNAKKYSDDLWKFRYVFE